MSKTRSETPNPTPCRELKSTAAVDEQRNINCPNYAACLDRALAWNGFSCKRCPLRNAAATDTLEHTALTRTGIE